MSPVNGWQFHQPQTGWDLQKAAPQAVWDFGSAVTAIIAHRYANPRFKLATDRKTVEDELDSTNALRMLSIPGAEVYVQADPNALPKTVLRPLGHKLQSAVAGANAIVSWISSGAEAVSQTLANERAEICATCPMNSGGDWMSLFTVPAQAAIRIAMNQRRDWKLGTPTDDRLHVCSACNCPLKLKVHMPIDLIKKNMPKEAYSNLASFCWIRENQGK